MRKPLILYSVITLLVFIVLVGCEKKPVEHLLGNIKLQNPYTGNETLIFLNSAGDSMIFIGQGRYSYTYEYKPVGTPYGYWINEKDICSFAESQNRYTFEIHLGSHAGSAYSISFRFGLVLEDPEDYCECYTSGLHIPLEDMYISPDHWIDSMSINNTVYKDIIVDSSLWTSAPYPQNSCNRFVSPIFYTIKNGFIKIDFEDGSSWGLKEVINK